MVYIFRTTQLLLFSTLLKVGASVLGLKLGQLSRKCEELIGKCLIMPVIVTEYLVKALFRVLYNSRTLTNCMSHFLWSPYTLLLRCRYLKSLSKRTSYQLRNGLLSSINFYVQIQEKLVAQRGIYIPSSKGLFSKIYWLNLVE